MKTTTATMLSRQVSRAVAAASRPSVRALSTSHAAQSKHAPSLGDIEPEQHETFNSRQKAFRAQLVEAQKQREARNAAQTATKEPPRKAGPLTNLIYGTKEGREMDAQIEASFSQVLARGKYVHSIVFHEVKPECVDEYVDLVGKWYPRMASSPENKVHLVGSWRTEVGDCDTFVHIWEYQRYQGYHASLHSISQHPEYPAFDKKLRSLVKGKSSSLMQEFSFWPTTPPRQLGGLFELRSYTLHPGNLLEWETHWRRGLKARREVMEGVGAWFVQIGDLNTVHHLWQFADLEERKIRREKSWGIEGWAETVHKTVPLIQEMKSRILIPMPWSPVA
ncbi:hypothetical protein B0H66DRAFT_95886 [Apodospora peruviana]|uniref:NIPSNAP domain-containing protein n=1 Tax=Apodospora peruviana TaxID=516989 RepID=A0AAE0MHM7_9PEZI|nr:hypothetical protein B0H66DRAFT_95886 [Apodospora peruviana]